MAIWYRVQDTGRWGKYEIEKETEHTVTPIGGMRVKKHTYDDDWYSDRNQAMKVAIQRCEKKVSLLKEQIMASEYQLNKAKQERERGGVRWETQ